MAMFIAGFSFILSAFNIWWTNKVRKDAENRDRDIREAAVKREQFCEFLQRPINRVLDELENVAEKLAAIASAGSIDSTDEVASINKEFTELHSRLRRELRKADDSQFANGSNWDDLTSSVFDIAADKLNAAYNPNISEQEKCSSISKASESIGAICSKVRGRLENEISNQTF